MRKFLIIFFILMIIYSLTLTYFIYEFYDSYIYTTMTLSSMILQNGHLTTAQLSDRSGFVEHDLRSKSTLPISHILTAIISLETSLPVDYIVFYPISSTIITLVIYQIVKYNHNNKVFNVKYILGVTYLITIGFGISIGPTISGPLYFISLGYTYFFIVIYLIIEKVQKVHEKIKVIIIMVLLIYVSSETYYTSIFLILSTLISATFINIILGKLFESNKADNILLILLFVISLVCFITFTEPIYEALVSIGKYGFENLVNILYRQISNVFLHLNENSYTALYKSPIKSNILLFNITRYIYTLSLLIILLLNIINYIITIRKIAKNYITDAYLIKLTYLIMLFLMISAFQVSVYFSYGQATYATLWITIGLLALFSLLFFNIPWFKNVSVYILVIFSILAIISGFVYRIIHVSDNYFTYYISLSEYHFSSYLLKFSDKNITYFLDHKSYFLDVFLFIKYGFKLDEIPRFILLSPESLATNSYSNGLCYIESQIPYIYLGVVGVIPKFYILNVNSNHFQLIFNSGLFMFKCNF